MNGEPGTALPMYSILSICGPGSCGLYVVSKAGVVVIATGSSLVLPLGVVATIVQYGSGPNLPSFLVGARICICRFSPTCIAEVHEKGHDMNL